MVPSFFGRKRRLTLIYWRILMGMSINAETRNDQGKGASRRLRRDEKVPAIVYGAGKDPINVSVSIHEITHLLENEEAFTSVLDLNVDKNKESVIVKDL